MRLLLIAYEFPPSPSPQSLRWTYLARELQALGHEVHVLAPDLGGETPGLPALPTAIRVHRTFPGFVRGMLAVLRKRSERKALKTAAAQRNRDGAEVKPVNAIQAIRPPRNWKQRVSERIQQGAEFAYYPDIRGEWLWWARRKLHQLLDTIAPDVVISSHEPATTLELGLIAKRRGVRWVADLGDPVLAGYTAERWRRRAFRIERDTCLRADVLSLTNEGAVDLLRQRHGRALPAIVIPQGFDAAGSPGTHEARQMFDPDRLELLYTGSFYQFRRSDALLDALDVHPSIRISIAAITVPESVLNAAARRPDQIRLLGFLPHQSILEMQRHADVLVNIANDDMTQIPGKFYEYLGAGRPLLHLSAGQDPMAKMIAELFRGWTCENNPAAIRSKLAELALAKASTRLDDGLELGQAPVRAFSWQQIAGRLDRSLRALGPSSNSDRSLPAAADRP